MKVIKTIRSTKAALESLNPVLLDDQIGYETDTKKWKIGDGIRPYKELPYSSGESAYEIWLRHGHSGTEEDFLDDLKGKSAFEEACETGHWNPAKDGNIDEFYKTITNVWNPLFVN
jgi:hypothetical protein